MLSVIIVIGNENKRSIIYAMPHVLFPIFNEQGAGHCDDGGD